jgi:hypothetical protein
MWLGEFAPGDTIDFKFTSRGTTGAPTTLSGTPAVSVYKGNGTVESTAGVTLTADFDGKTGLNHVRIDTTADGTFYATASDFQVVITAGTVGGTSVVGEVVGHFTLHNRSVVVGVVNDKTGYALTSAYDPAKSAAPVGAAMTLTSAYDAAKTAAPVGAAMTLTSVYDPAKGAAQTGDPMTLTAGERQNIANAHLDLANAVESGLTPRGAFRLMSAALAGKSSGGGTATIVFNNAVTNSKPRITATVDGDSNRTAIVWDVT